MNLEQKKIACLSELRIGANVRKTICVKSFLVLKDRRVVDPTTLSGRQKFVKLWI